MTMPQTVVAANGLDFGYGKTHILHDINVSVSAGERVGIVGESGSGKTTLAKLLVGILRSKQVTVNGKPWSQWSRRSEVRRAVQLVQQDPYASLTPELTIQSAVTEAVQVCRGLPHTDARDVAARLLGSVGIGSHLFGRRPGTLSGGQCQRVSIARALAPEPTLLFGDEPTSSLDLSVQAQIINLLLELTETRKVGLVLISHDLAVVGHLTERMIVLQDGRIVEAGATRDVLWAPKHEYTRSLCKAAVSNLGD